jgi:hypothetical protein
MTTERNPNQQWKTSHNDLAVEENVVQRKSVLLSSRVEDHSAHSMLYEVGSGTVKHDSDKEITAVQRAETALASPQQEAATKTEQTFVSPSTLEKPNMRVELYKAGLDNPRAQPKFTNHLRKGGGMLANVTNNKRSLTIHSQSLPLGEPKVMFKPK